MQFHLHRKVRYWKPRYYQDNAITKVVDSIAQGKNRHNFNIMATGTGKTAIAFQISWKLFQSRWNLNRDGKMPRILFLADRNILADQAFNSFSAFDEDALVRISNLKRLKKTGNVPTNGSIFFTIFQTFMSGENVEPYFGEYPEDYFDLIIIDECHRGDKMLMMKVIGVILWIILVTCSSTWTNSYKKTNINIVQIPIVILVIQYIYILKKVLMDGFLTPHLDKQVHTTFR